MNATRVAVIGTFDVDNYGDHLFARVASHELRRRLPGAQVDAYSPYGWLHPTRLDDGMPVTPLGPWSEEQADRVADAHDCLLVGGGELIHLNDPLLAPVYGRSPSELASMAPSAWFVEGLGARREATTPMVWHAVGVPGELDAGAAERVGGALDARAYVTVRDPMSAARIERAAPGVDIAVVPDSALLLNRLFDGTPPSRDAVVIQGCDLVVPYAASVVDRVVAALRDHPRLELVLLETGRCRGDGAFADAAAARLRSLAVPFRRVPAEASLDDLVAVLASSRVFVGSSLHGAITALSFGQSFVLLNLAAEAKLDGFGAVTGLEACVVHDVSEIADAIERSLAARPDPALLAGLQRRVDEHFDRIAAIASASAAFRSSVRSDAGSRSAPRPTSYDIGAAAARAYAQMLDEHAARAESELHTLRATKTLRYTSVARRVYARARAASLLR